MFQIPIANQAPDGPLAMISPSNTVNGLTRPYGGMRPGELGRLYPLGQRNYVRIAAADHLSAAALVQTARELGLRRVFVAWDGDDSYMEGFAVDMRAAARRSGVEVVGAAAWDPHARTFAGFARTVASARPQAVLMAGAAPPHVGALLGSLRAEVGDDVTLLASDGFAGFPGLIADAGPAATGMYVANYGIPNGKLPPAGRRFLREFVANGGEASPDFSAAYAAQAAEILLDAIARSDGTRPSVTRELFRTEVEDGILGDIRFDEHGDLVEGPVTIYRIVGGRPVVDRVVTASLPTT
jgi:branched-chain amino acid transport system substrate-binding protein